MQKSCFLRCAWRLSEARQEDKETMAGEYYKDKPSHDAAIWRLLEAERGYFGGG